ncbi:TetR/AcrR family transcriptional regulator [Bradyrhizobium sp. USDA 4486]
MNVASKRFRKDGVSLGIVEVMKTAGLTHGGFYSHFDSKEDLVRSAVLEASAGQRERMNAAAEQGGLEGMLREYLGRAHRDRPETGCAFAALGSEISRLSRKSRGALTRELGAVFDLIARQLPEQTPAEGRRKAMQILCIMVGSLQLARTVEDPDLSEGILSSGRQAALALALSGHESEGEMRFALARRIPDARDRLAVRAARSVKSRCARDQS